MNVHLVSLRSRGNTPRRTPRSTAAPHPAELRSGAEQVAAALGAPVQTKLMLGAADNASERAADATAERVMAMPAAASDAGGGEQVRRKCAACAEEDEAVHRKESPAASTATAANATPLATAAATRIQSRRGSGKPLPASERQFFEPRFGRDLGEVRVHDDADAARLNRGLGARAFTVGRDVFLGAGEYRPGSQDGRRLLAHELAHVQQNDERTLQRKIDWVDVGKTRIDVYLSLGIYGSRATKTLAAKWAANIESQWTRPLKLGTQIIDARMHVDYAAYPTLPDASISHAAIDESNAVFVEKNGFRSIVKFSCGWGIDEWSCGRWANDAAPMVIAHEAGHMMGLEDQYVDTPTGSKDKPGYEKDIMANFWNDNGKTDFSRGWLGLLLHYYYGIRF